MIPIKKLHSGLALLALGMLISSCGPAPEELAATAAAETAAAATSTPTITPTLPPTSTPTITPTPTPLPDPDPKAMIDWEALNLPEGYQSLDPYQLGFGTGDWIMGVQREDGTQVDYTIESSFVFGEAWPEVAYGWTVLFPTDFDGDVLEWYIDNYASQLASIVQNTQGVLVSLIDNTENPEYKTIGDQSAEAWAVYMAEGQFWVLWGAAFRIEDIGGFVFLRHPMEEEQFIPIGDLARIYAESIAIPTSHCTFTAIDPDPDSDLPAFEYRAEGFYPGEPFLISLSGDVMLNGEVERYSMVDPLGDVVDQSGKFHGKMRFGDEALDLASPDFELMIMGAFSNCVVSQEVTWPDS